MTNEEMAVNLISTATAMESTSGPTPLTASMRAGAAALRAGEWKPIADAPEVIEHGNTRHLDRLAVEWLSGLDPKQGDFLTFLEARFEESKNANYQGS